MTLEWNYSTRCYETELYGQLIQVDGDAFAEAEQEMVAECGMSEQEAFEALLDVNVWTGDMDGVSFKEI